MRKPLPTINANVKSAQTWRPSTATPPQPRQSLLTIDGYADHIRPAEAATRDDATVIGVATSGSTVHDALHLCAVRSASSRGLQIGDGVRDCLKLRVRYTEPPSVVNELVQQA